MAIIKPTDLPRWGEAVGSQGVAGPNEVAPNSAKLDIGWANGEKPVPSAYFNWWQRLVFDWVQYLNDLTNQALTWNAVVTFAAGLVGNLTGNVSGSSGSCTGNSATATSAATAAALSAPTTRDKLPAVGQQISGSSGSFGTTSAAFVDVTSLSVTITTTGRPVMLRIQSDGTASDPIVDSTVAAGGSIQFTRAGTRIAGCKVPSTIASPGFSFLDTPAAGTYVYKLQAKGDGTQITNVQNVLLVAYEL